ncbi:hypothetical protein ShzoTeo12_11410 [Shinella zoogloeoides]|nr:hypothetical protein ShzoTeo12_11410 [Shinella zoogloeoides]
MEHDGQENLQDEEGAATPALTLDEQPQLRRRRASKAEPAPSRDVGDWKYRPWNGIDHWVNPATGASTFNPKNTR